MGGKRKDIFHTFLGGRVRKLIDLLVRRKNRLKNSEDRLLVKLIRFWRSSL